MKKVVTAILLGLLSACGALLPKSNTAVKHRWDSFESARGTFDRIVPYQTTASEMVQMGYDPFSNPAVTILTYADVIRRLIPPSTIDSMKLNRGIGECVSDRDCNYCYGEYRAKGLYNHLQRGCRTREACDAGITWNDRWCTNRVRVFSIKIRFGRVPRLQGKFVAIGRDQINAVADSGRNARRDGLLDQIHWEKPARVVEEQTGIDQDVTLPVVIQSEPKTIERYFGFLTKIKTFTASPDRLIIVVLTMDILLASVAETKAE